MLKNYITVALRSLSRNFGYSAINIVGLAAGMAAAILILLWVTDEISFDRFHKNLPELYRVYEHQSYTGTDDLIVYNTPGPLAPYLGENFPNIKHSARFTPIWQRVIMATDEDSFYESNGYFADPQALQMFTFSFTHGVALSALKEPNSIVLTEETARKLFGDADPLGKTITINKNMLFEVTGVIDRPRNTHLNFSFIIPFEGNIDRFWTNFSTSWTNNSFFTYLQIDSDINFKEIEHQIANVIIDKGQSNVTLLLEPLSRSYLYNIWGSGSITNVRIFSAIAFLVLLIACINFMNLTTARSSMRAKEVGMRKVSGGNQENLIGQFLGESLLLTFISLVLAIVLVILLLPSFNNLSAKDISLSAISSSTVWGILLVTFLTGLISGSYPAFFLSSFQPVTVLKGYFSQSSRTFRTVLVVFQFSLSVALIVSTLLVTRQLNYMQSKNLGFLKDNIVTLRLNQGGLLKYNAFKEQLMGVPGVIAVTASNALPNQIGNSTSGLEWEGKAPDESALFSNILVHYDFMDVFGMKLSEGRGWNPVLASDSFAIVVNQEAVSVMGFDNPVGQRVSLSNFDVEIIGVVENFNFQNLKYKVEPLIMYIAMPWHNRVSIKLNPKDIQTTMESIERVWREVYPEEMFSFRFFDQEFDSMYRAETRMAKLFRYFSILAILISCLGLFGLATFTTQSRFREIGIRKALGASSVRVMHLMVWEFIKWVLLANISGWIIAYYTMELWLRSYAYRIDIEPQYFILAGAISVTIAFITVGYHALKASRVNPVRVLKYE